MAQRYTSDKLYHFVGWHHPTDADENYKTLKMILEGECVKPRGGEGVTITIDWSKNIYEGELLSPTVICFADIPRDCLPIHTRKYGEFGLAFERELLANYGSRPVTYIPYHPQDSAYHTIHGRVLIESLIKASRDFHEKIVKDKNSTYQREVIEELFHVLARDVLAFVKVFDRTQEDDSPLNYYMEREWRMYTALNFAPEWVQEVVVSQEFIKKACEDFPQYADRVRPCPR
jgi:hypothetical protein